MTGCDIAIIGAGPYGISASAHLRTIKGLDVHTFGEPMVFWQKNMPKGMLLRSGWEASHIADPNQSLTLDIFRKESRNHFSSPVPLDRFVNYGLWHQQHSVPDLDRRRIVCVEPGTRGFRLILEDGESVLTSRVVIAAGISSFTWRPPEFANLPSALATHTSEHRDFESFSGREVLVIGGGQSALESAALLHESGARVELVARAGQIRWLGGVVSRTIHRGFGPTISKLLYAPTDVGPAGISQIVARPDLVRRFSRPIQDWLRKRSIRPAGARWLVNRLKDVPMHLGCAAVSATVKGERIRVRLDDGSERDFEHVFPGNRVSRGRIQVRFPCPQTCGFHQPAPGIPATHRWVRNIVPGVAHSGSTRRLEFRSVDAVRRRYALFFTRADAIRRPQGGRQSRTSRRTASR